jgi:ElaB/YqjD/DUF883 family membrane-anchored ribosome-binding protein
MTPEQIIEKMEKVKTLCAEIETLLDSIPNDEASSEINRKIDKLLPAVRKFLKEDKYEDFK